MGRRRERPAAAPAQPQRGAGGRRHSLRLSVEIPSRARGRLGAADGPHRPLDGALGALDGTKRGSEGGSPSPATGRRPAPPLLRYRQGARCGTPGRGGRCDPAGAQIVEMASAVSKGITSVWEARAEDLYRALRRGHAGGGARTARPTVSKLKLPAKQGAPRAPERRERPEQERAAPEELLQVRRTSQRQRLQSCFKFVAPANANACKEADLPTPGVPSSGGREDVDLLPLSQPLFGGPAPALRLPRPRPSPGPAPPQPRLSPRPPLPGPAPAPACPSPGPPRPGPALPWPALPRPCPGPGPALPEHTNPEHTKPGPGA
eukprot:tig00000663_g2941.t1